MDKFTFIIGNGQIRDALSGVFGLSAMDADSLCERAWADPRVEASAFRRLPIAGQQAAQTSVFSLLLDVHNSLVEWVRQHEPALTEKLAAAIGRTASQYRTADAAVDASRVLGLLAPDPFLAGEFGHATVDGRSVFFPDLVVEREFFARVVPLRDDTHPSGSRWWHSDNWPDRLLAQLKALPATTFAELRKSLEKLRAALHLYCGESSDPYRAQLEQLLAEVEADEEDWLHHWGYGGEDPDEKPLPPALVDRVREQETAIVDAVARVRVLIAAEHRRSLPQRLWRSPHRGGLGTTVHLSDSVRDVFSASERYFHRVQEELAAHSGQPTAGTTALDPVMHAILIDAPSARFRGDRRLRRALSGDRGTDAGTAIGASPSATFAAVRYGMGWPAVSALFPRETWQYLGANPTGHSAPVPAADAGYRSVPTHSHPVHGFVLDAAEAVATGMAKPLLPGELQVADQEALSWFCEEFDGDCVSSDSFRAAVVEWPALQAALERWLAVPKGEPLPADLKDDPILRRAGSWIYGGGAEPPATRFSLFWKRLPALRRALDKLGALQLVSERLEEVQNGRPAGEALLDFSFRFGEPGEYREWQRIQRLLHLQPLHKRVLGLIEYVLAPKIRQSYLNSTGRPAEQPVTALWARAFTGIPALARLQHPLKKDDDELATLETLGNWHDTAAASQTTEPLDLAEVLDGILKRMSTAPELRGLQVSLTPKTPDDHLRQLLALSTVGDEVAARMTLYLGKLVTMLRNAVEHGADWVEGDELRVDVRGYWTKAPPLAWMRNQASRLHWRTRLPISRPDAANAFQLTPASLSRCMVLVSLVIQGARAHLGI